MRAELGPVEKIKGADQAYPCTDNAQSYRLQFPHIPVLSPHSNSVADAIVVTKAMLAFILNMPSGALTLAMKLQATHTIH